jgi:hypothetical protein
MSDFFYLGIVLLHAVVLWELVARTTDTPSLPLGPAELAVRLGLVESIAARLAAPPEANHAPVLPPPPTERLAPAQAAVRYPVLEFERKNFNHYEQQLAQLDWVLGFWCGHSWPGGLRCDDRVKH